ncbi:Phophatidylserine decarboxylase-domain-containing protein [Sordaria brevicollis]|uniref:Phophatidylserine decarboxylase-domain-containing protein n=1 Tax=Sordaria brevicollis TaxID=83679 RepID=A0AAE0UDY2_SORBR|nr:Phophatidylserine decarboxylase-domain-containing protein [Sordaria brevicollis]
MVWQYGDHHDIPNEHRIHRRGGWLPTDHRILKHWLSHHIKQVDSDRAANRQRELVSVLKEFQDLIESNARIYMYFSSMWDEVPHKPPYNKDVTGRSQIRDYKHMLDVLNQVFGKAPEWTDSAAGVGMVGVPLAAIFDYASGTPSGHAAFLDPDVNAMLKKILNEWGAYLKSPESASVLGNNRAGWFGEIGTKDLMEVANSAASTNYTKFEDIFQCPDPSAPNKGFKSWDDFFTRRFHPSARPIASPDNDLVVANACESKPYALSHDVKLRDKFWIKGQPYSVLDMLAHDPSSSHFAGGTVYQAFLSALSYHRWHSPVSGTIKRAFVEQGTYFSEPLFSASSSDDPSIDRTGKEGEYEILQKGITQSQGYLTALATRAIFLIEAAAPEIGLMAFIAVGMDEVSSCEITVKEGQKVKKGDELGMFHFGGSTHCLIFRGEVGKKMEGWPRIGREENVPVRGRLCEVGKGK